MITTGVKILGTGFKPLWWGQGMLLAQIFEGHADLRHCCVICSNDRASFVWIRIICKHLIERPCIVLQGDLSDAEASCTVNKQAVLVPSTTSAILRRAWELQQAV